MTPAMPGAVHHSPGVKDLLTSELARACHYAAVRPGCHVLAAVCYGPVPLCAGCDQQRSTLGKGYAAVRLPDPHTLLEIAAARDASQQASMALHAAVAAILEVSRQAAQQRFARLGGHW